MKIAFDAPDDWPIENANINVVIFEEAGEWTAVALEMDLHAIAPTMEAARRELAEAVMSQLAFAIQKRQPELVFRNAEPMYWRLFEQGRDAKLRALVTDQAVSPNIVTASLPVDDGLISQFQRKKPFQRQRAAA
ncbi:MAG: hypothetical protein VYC42_01620 [Pseudomonadota bacterium]|nr:hypothetical protein [Pseudomonadota bacterium]